MPVPVPVPPLGFDARAVVSGAAATGLPVVWPSGGALQAAGVQAAGEAGEVLAEKALDGSLVFADVDQPPVVLAGERVEVFFAQEALVVGLFQLLDRAGIVLELLIVDADGAGVLLGAVLSFELAVALDVHGDARRGDRQGEQQQEDEHDDADQHVAGLGVESRVLLVLVRLAQLTPPGGVMGGIGGGVTCGSRAMTPKVRSYCAMFWLEHRRRAPWPAAG